MMFCLVAIETGRTDWTWTDGAVQTLLNPLDGTQIGVLVGIGCQSPGLPQWLPFSPTPWRCRLLVGLRHY